MCTGWKPYSATSGRGFQPRLLAGLPRAEAERIIATRAAGPFRSLADLAHGQLQREHEVIHVLVNKLEDLTAVAGRIPARSRDFQ